MKEYKTTKSEVAKHILIKSCYKIVLSIARRFYSFNPDVDFMDLVQYGFLGLLDALEKFDMSYEKQRLAFFAERFIRLYISNGLCNLKANITYPQHYYETNYFLNIFFEKFYKENNRFPKQIEILDELNWKMYTNIKLETVRYILDLYKTEFISIEESEEQGLLYSIVDTTEIDYEYLKKGLEEAILTCLNPRYQDIIEMRFGLINYSHPIDVEEICEKYHFSKTRFNIIYHTAIRQLSWYMKYSNMTNFYRFEEVLNHERL